MSTRKPATAVAVRLQQGQSLERMALYQYLVERYSTVGVIEN